MNTKFASALIFGLVATQLITPSFNASDVKQPVVEQAEIEVNYAPLNATKSQVRAAAPTDLVEFNDPALKNAIAGVLSVDAGEITVEKMQSLEVISLNWLNITDLTGLEYATNLRQITLQHNKISNLGPLSGLNKLTAVSVGYNNVTDITPVAGLTDLETFDAVSNKISNIKPLEGLNKLKFVSLAMNKISDFSPLTTIAKDGPLQIGDMLGQEVTLPDVTVATNAEITFDIIGIDNVKHTVVLGTPVNGTNTLEGNINVQHEYNNIFYNVRVSQKVTYTAITASEVVQINEGNALTDAELIELFNVHAANPANTIVDQATVNYNKPDTYNVVFKNGEDTVTSLLTVNNVDPKLILTTDTVTVQVGETIEDYVNAFGAVATEFTTGDLTASINVDSSAVDFSKAGTYNVTLTVTDEEDTSVSKTGNVVVTTEEPTNPEEPTTEEGTKTPITEEGTKTPTTEEGKKTPITEEGTKTPTTEEGTKTPTTKESNETATTEESTETATTEESTKTATTDNASKVSTVAMTDGSKKTLASTGNKTVMILAVYTTIITILVSVKKIIISKN